MATRQHPPGSVIPLADPILARHTSVDNTIPRYGSSIPTFIVVLDVKTNSLHSVPPGKHPGEQQAGHDDSSIESLIPLDRFKIQLLIRRTIRTGRAQKEEFRIHSGNGEIRTVESETIILLDEFQQVSKVIVTSRDTTDQTRIRAALQESTDLKNAFLEAFIQSTDDAMMGETREGTIVSWNKGAELLYGYSSDEAMGRPMSIIIPQDREDELPALRARIKQGEVVDWFESEQITREGKRTNVVMRMSPVYLPAGELIGALVISRDVTPERHSLVERKILIRELHNAREELKTLRGMLPICAWCKKVRDNEGYWGHIEFYFESHSHMQFTHGICPECVEKYHQRADKNITDVEGL